MVNAPILLAAALAACLWPTDQSSEGATPGLSMDPQAPPVDTTLVPSADAWTWHPHPNDNFGTTTDLRTGVNGNGRAFLRWAPQAIQDAVGSMTLLMARVEVTVQSSTGWSGSGGYVGLYRMTKDWTELGATDNCAIDAVPGNGHKDCSGVTAWSLHDPAQAPWGVPPTDSVFLTNGQTGTVTFDVTADVAAFLAGTANYGWALKPTNDAAASDVRVGSRESTSPPVLVLTVAGDTSRPPIPDGFTSPDSAEALLVSPPGDDSVLVLRNFVELVFEDTTSGFTINEMLARYGAQIAGGDQVLKSYMVQIPDPGATYTALDSVLASMRREPGVRHAIRYVFRAPNRDPGRYPDDDGQGMRRRDWIDAATDGTRALRAIRAPQAWGCETGLYGGPGIEVGVVENIVATDLPDLDSSAVAVHSANPGATLNPRQLGSSSLSHGTSVAGVLTGRGDNGLGVAGISWHTRLHVFRLARELGVGNVTMEVQNRAQALARAIRIAADSTSVRVLHSSVEAPADSAAAARIAEAIADFVGTAPGRVFVQAGQNFRYTIRPDTIFNIRQGSFVMHQALVLLDAATRERVLFVGAANRDGTDIWGPNQPPNVQGGATLTSGITDILAPGEDLLTLVRPQDYSGDSVATRSGTSFAAPMVAGTAALLWAFDSTLTAEEVKNYILAGARERLGPDGTLVNSPVIPNSGDLNLLDAYEALARASRERPTTTPVCGGQVWVGDTAVYVDHGAGAPLRIVPVGATSPYLAHPSLAQGGRSIALSNLAMVETWEVDTRPPHPRIVLPGVYARQYLERGTADLKQVELPSDPYFAWTLSLTVRGTGTDLTDVRFESLVVPPGAIGASVSIIRVSPLGDLAAVFSTGITQPSEESHRWDVVRLTDPPQLVGAPITSWLDLQEPPYCWTDCPSYFRGDVTWSHDSRRAVFTLWRRDFVVDSTGSATVSGMATRVVSVENGGGPVAVDSAEVAAAWLVHPRFTPDDSLLVAEHPVLQSAMSGYYVGPPCQERRREPSVPFAERVGAARDALLPDLCFPYWGEEQQGPGIFNAPPASIATGRGEAAYRPRRVSRPTRH